MTALLFYRCRHFLQELEACRNKPLLVGSCFLKWVSWPVLAAWPLRITGRGGIGLIVTVHQILRGRVCVTGSRARDHKPLTRAPAVGLSVVRVVLSVGCCLLRLVKGKSRASFPVPFVGTAERTVFLRSSIEREAINLVILGVAV